MSGVLKDYIGVLKQNCCFYLGDFLVVFVYWIQSVSVRFANWCQIQISLIGKLAETVKIVRNVMSLLCCKIWLLNKYDLLYFVLVFLF